MSGRKAKELRWRFRFWFERGLNDDGIVRQTEAPIRKVKRERARLINIYKRKEEKHRPPAPISVERIRELLTSNHLLAYKKAMETEVKE